MASSGATIWAFGTFFLALVGGINGRVAGGNGNSSNNNLRHCKFPAIFNFGDSNSDTGAADAAIMSLNPPNGMSFNLSKRSCDGRLIIDFIAENLGLPYLEAPLDTLGTSFRNGANFATGGTRISPVVIDGFTIPLHLDVQVSEFLLFKSRSIALHKQLRKNGPGSNPPVENKFPSPGVFSKALYTIDIGQNDDFNISTIPPLIDQFSHSVQRLLEGGARFLWIHSSGPQGCFPFTISQCQKTPGCLLDQHGCSVRKNELTREFNRQLKDKIYKLRAQYPQAAITFVDIYSAKYDLISNARTYGFEDPFKQCCGNATVSCAKTEFNGTPHGILKLIGTACPDPARHVNWDGMHYTQAANQFIAKQIVSGSLSDPPLPIAEACDHKL